jgi:Protein of unknown function (DUF3618)
VTGEMTDPQVLRAEIEQTRAELGDTVATLAARTDVKARARDGVNQATARAKQTLARVRDQARVQVDAARVQLTGIRRAASAQVRSGVSAARESTRDVDPRMAVRRAVPVAVIAAAAIGVGVVRYLVRRCRT